MYEAYFDDSGTNAQSEIAIAACYVSTRRGWVDFVNEWDLARHQEGFDTFHMAEFVAPVEQGHQPWCGWDKAKKDRVYKRLANIINENKRIGIGSAIPKAVYDALPERIRNYHGSEHYTFAVRMCLMRIMEWRKKSLISLPIQYIFDWETPGTRKHKELSDLMEGVHPNVKPELGLDGGGYSFQSRKNCKPLQAADILAWQMNRYMPKIYPNGEAEENIDGLIHPGFLILRQDQEMDLGFFTEFNMKAWVKKIEEFEALNGQYY
jgi:Protein of unknown function (DUF3800)